MKKLLLLLILLITLACPVKSEEQIVLVRNYDLKIVGEMLKDGWKVKHQSVSISTAAATANTTGTFSNNHPQEFKQVIFLFTLEKN